MHHLIRKIHLYAGLIIVTFLMMYCVSGYTMAHRPWFLPPSPPRSARTVTFDAIAASSPEQVAADVKNKLALPGRVQFPQEQPPGETLFWAIRPGSMIRVDVLPRTHVVRLITQRVGLVGTLIMPHKVAGYDDQPLFDLVAFFCDLAGLSLIQGRSESRPDDEGHPRLRRQALERPAPRVPAPLLGRLRTPELFRRLHPRRAPMPRGVPVHIDPMLPSPHLRPSRGLPPHPSRCRAGPRRQTRPGAERFPDRRPLQAIRATEASNRIGDGFVFEVSTSLADSA